MGQVVDKADWKNNDMSQNFMKIQSIHDNSLGYVTIVRDKQSGVQYLLKKRWIAQGEDAQKFCNEIVERSTFVHPNLLRIYGYLRKENPFNQQLFNDAGNSGMPQAGGYGRGHHDQLPGTGLGQGETSNGTVLALILEYVDYNFEQELLKHRTKNSPFPEGELWYIAFSIISAGNFIQERNICHGNISPRNILVTRDGKVKLYDNAIIHSKPFDIDALMKQGGYYSPLMMQVLQTKKWGIPQNFHKSDVYSLGMTLLEAATLVPVHQTVYDWYNLKVNQQAVQSLIHQLSSRYSPSFIELLQLCLCPDERSRPDWVELETKYQTKLEPALLAPAAPLGGRAVASAPLKSIANTTYKHQQAPQQVQAQLTPQQYASSSYYSMSAQCSALPGQATPASSYHSSAKSNAGLTSPTKVKYHENAQVIQAIVSPSKFEWNSPQAPRTEGYGSTYPAYQNQVIYAQIPPPAAVAYQQV
jgi:serine/threonine protein kinase